MRRIQQPGTGTPERVQWVECGGRAFSLTLPAGVALLEAVRSGFAAEGFASGVVKLDGLKLSPFAYVMPALSKTPEHAAFYSDTYRPEGGAQIEVGAMTFGQPRALFPAVGALLIGGGPVTVGILTAANAGIAAIW